MMDYNRYLIFIEYAPVFDGELPQPPYFNQADSLRMALRPLFDIPPNQFSQVTAAANDLRCYVKKMAVVDLATGQVAICRNTPDAPAAVPYLDMSLQIAPGVDRVLLSSVFPQLLYTNPDKHAFVDLLVHSADGHDLCTTQAYQNGKRSLEVAEPVGSKENQQDQDPYLLFFVWTLNTIDGDLSARLYNTREFSNAQQVVDYTNRLSSALMKGPDLQQHGVPLRLKEISIINRKQPDVMLSVSRSGNHSLSVSLAGNLPADFDNALKAAAYDPDSLLSTLLSDRRKRPRKLGEDSNGGQKKSWR